MGRHLYIGGKDRWRDYERNTLVIDSALTYQIDTCRFHVKGERPMEGAEVIVEEDGLDRLFAGIIVKVDLAWELPDKSNRVWSVECDDYTVFLDRYLVVEIYENMSASDIFLDIVSQYCPGFTVNGVQLGAPPVEYLRFDYEHPSASFKQLCDYVGWNWKLNYFKDLTFFDRDINTFPAPMVLQPGGSFRNFKISVDERELRNRVYVLGGRFLSDPQPFEYVGNGKQRIWPLPHEPHSPWVSIAEGEPIKPGLEYVDDESEYDWMYSIKDKYIRCSAGTPTPIDGATVEFTYSFPMDVITMGEDLLSQQRLAAVQGGDGVYEHKIVDDTLITIEAAEAEAQADLREHANPKVSGSFETERPGWYPGQIVTINLPERGAVGEYIIQKVNITPASSYPSLWTYKVEYGGRLLGIPDLLQALVSAQKSKAIVDVKYQQKFVVVEEKLGILDSVAVFPRINQWFFGDADAIFGECVCLAPPPSGDGTFNSIASSMWSEIGDMRWSELSLPFEGDGTFNAISTSIWSQIAGMRWYEL